MNTPTRPTELRHIYGDQSCQCSTCIENMAPEKQRLRSALRRLAFSKVNQLADTWTRTQDGEIVETVTFWQTGARVVIATTCTNPSEIQTTHEETTIPVALKAAENVSLAREYFLFELMVYNVNEVPA